MFLQILRKCHKDQNSLLKIEAFKEQLPYQRHFLCMFTELWCSPSVWGATPATSVFLREERGQEVASVNCPAGCEVNYSLPRLRFKDTPRGEGMLDVWWRSSRCLPRAEFTNPRLIRRLINSLSSRVYSRGGERGYTGGGEDLSLKWCSEKKLSRG